jgi:hypothetical protein
VPRREDRSIEQRLEDLERVAELLRVVHVWTEIEIVERGPEPVVTKAAEIPAAEAVEPVVEVVERRRDIDLLFDPTTGARLLRTEANAPAFDMLAARARECGRSIRIPLRMHAAQVGPVLSRAKLVAVLGGNRAGKTRVLLLRFVRMWLLRGRAPTSSTPGAMFWWIGPTIEKAYKFGWARGLKLLLPAELVVSYPRSHRAAQVIKLLDGTTIELQHAQDDGSNLKSENVDAIAGDEIGVWKHEGNWQQVASRISQAGASACVSTTPVAGHWGRTKIVLQEPHSGGAIQCFHVDIFDNPWMTRPRVWSLLLLDGSITEAELDERVLCSPDPPAAARSVITAPRALREHFGVWTAEGVRLWSEWTESIERQCTRTGGSTSWPTLTTSKRLVAGRWVEPETLPNITAQACATIFPPEKCTTCAGTGCGACKWLGYRPLDRVAGQDFNVNPETTLPIQIFGHAHNPASWVVLVLEEIQTVGTIEAHADRLLGIDRDLALICDPSGDIPRRKQGALDSDDASRLRASGFRVVSAVGRGRTLKSQHPTLTLLHKLQRERRVYVHLRCTQTLRALQTQQARPDGRIDKRSGVNSPSDQLSAPTDALRYAVWRIFKHELEDPTSWET